MLYRVQPGSALMWSDIDASLVDPQTDSTEGERSNSSARTVPLIFAIHIPALTGVLVILGLLTACSAPAENVPTTEPGPATSGPAVLSNFMCDSNDEGVWRGKATLKNVGAVANNYTVRFSVVRSSDSGVVGMREDDFTVDPGQSVDIAFPNITTSQATGLECVHRIAAQPAE